MEENYSHAAENSLVYLFCQLIGNIVMLCMSPPEKNVCIFKNFIRKTAVRLVQSCLRECCKRKCIAARNGRKLLFLTGCLSMED